MGEFESIGSVQPFLKLQAGEWADVYKAYDASLEKNVLLKKLKSIYKNDAEIAERFQAEVHLMAQIKHQNVVSVLDSGQVGQSIYFIAEFVEGLSVKDLLESGAMPAQVAAFVLGEIVQGLAAAHEQKIFHRDIKPANVLVSTQGEVKLTDFGMASLTESMADGEIRGTFGFIAPELLFDGEPGEATDIFSVGATFFEMLTGMPAFAGSSSREIFDKILNHDPIPILAANPSVYKDLIKICRKCLEKEPDLRYPNCKSLLADINAFLGKAKAFDGTATVISYIENPDGFTEDLALVEAFASEQAPGASLQTIQSTLHVRRGILVGIVLLAFVMIGLWMMPRPIDEHKSGNSDQVIQNNNAALALESLASESGGEDTASSELDTTLAAQPIERELRPSEQIDDKPEFEVPVPEQVSSTTLADSLVTDTSTVSRDIEDGMASGFFNVSCTPFCSVFAGGDSIGTAPPMVSLELSPGVHQITLAHPELPAYMTDVFVEAGQTDSIKVSLRDYVGVIDVSVIPWAHVFVNDEPKGVAPPPQTLLLPPGIHVLRLEHHWGIVTDTLRVVAGEAQTKLYNMRELIGD